MSTIILITTVPEDVLKSRHYQFATSMSDVELDQSILVLKTVLEHSGKVDSLLKEESE